MVALYLIFYVIWNVWLLMKPWLCPSSSPCPTTAGKSALALLFALQPNLLAPFYWARSRQVTRPVPTCTRPRAGALETAPAVCSVPGALRCTGPPGTVSLGEFRFPSPGQSSVLCPSLRGEEILNTVTTFTSGLQPGMVSTFPCDFCPWATSREQGSGRSCCGSGGCDG